jgi:hypothetical protein
MFGTVLLFVLLTPGVLVTLNLGFKQKLAPVIIHAVIFAFLLANYRSIPLLNMIEPFQLRRSGSTAGGTTNRVAANTPMQNVVAPNAQPPTRT